MRKVTTAAGLFWCLVFLILDAGQAVWFGAALQNFNSFLVGLTVFGLSSLACLAYALTAARGDLAAAFSDLPGLAGLNVSAAGGWVLWLIGVQLIEPAVAFMLFSGVIPLVTIAAARLGFSEGEGNRNRLEWAGNGLIALSIAVLCVVTLTGLSGFVRGGAATAFAGLACALGGGIFIAWMLLFSQRLDRRGVGPVAQFALRFPLYLCVAAFCWIAGFDAKPGFDPAGFWLTVGAGMVLLAFPIYAVQKAVSLASPLTIAVTAAAAPVLIFLFQAAEGRVEAAPATALGLAIGFAGALIAGAGTARSFLESRRAKPV